MFKPSIGRIYSGDRHWLSIPRNATVGELLRALDGMDYETILCPNAKSRLYYVEKRNA